MATSSIFHNVVLRNPKDVEDFLTALEASEADPYVSSRLYTKLCFDGTNSLQLLRKIVSIHRKLYRLRCGSVK